jgi:hypothetical protein
MRNLIAELRKQAAEIAQAGHAGWGNTMHDAADQLAAQSAALDAARDACQDAYREMLKLGNDTNWPFEIPISYAEAMNKLKAALPALGGGE